MSLVLSARDWAEQEFAAVELGDERRSKRAVKVAEAMLTPHWRRTRASAGECAVVLMIQDTTQLDYTAHPGCDCDRPEVVPCERPSKRRH